MANEEDLIDYSDEELAPNESALATLAKPKENTKLSSTHVGIHSTSFREFLLKPELLRSITDCGFEHPSEGK